MKSLGNVRAGLMLLVVLSLAVGQTPQPQPTTLPIGSATIAEVKGDVSIRSPEGAALGAQRGSLLPAETTIETVKGSVVLDLQDGSQVLVKANSKVVLKAPSEDKGFYLELMIGKIIAKVQKRLQNAPSFRMGTPTAVITVRGTRFSVEVNKKQRTLVEVFEGLVEVQSLQLPGPPVLLRPGFETGVGRDRTPEQPRQFDEGPGSAFEREGNGPGQYGGEREGSGQSRPGGETEKEPH
ncbi:MAG: FecR family protein [Acidobacteriia bacterium]|nr:FecR family protein [Terriglobia bacterium]